MYKNRNKKKDAYKSEQGTSQNSAVPTNSKDTSSKHANILQSTLTSQKKDDQTKSIGTSTNGNLKVRSTNSNISGDSADSHVQSSPATSNKRSNIQHPSFDHKIESDSLPTNQNNTVNVEGCDVLGKSNDKRREESSSKTPSSIEDFKPSHNSTFKPHLLPPDAQIRRSELSKSRKSHPPASRDIASLRPPTPIPSAFSYDRSFRRSVTFNSTPDVHNLSSSFNDFEEYLQSSRSSSSSEMILSANKSQQFISKQFDAQPIKNKVHDHNSRALQKVSFDLKDFCAVRVKF